jgi:hypothetical protein
MLPLTASSHHKQNHTHLGQPATSASSSHAVRRTTTCIQRRRCCCLLSQNHSNPRPCKPIDTQRSRHTTTIFNNHIKHNRTHLGQPATSVSSSHAVRCSTTRIQLRRCRSLLSHNHSNPRRCKPVDTQSNSCHVTIHSFSNHGEHNHTHRRQTATSVPSSHAVRRTTTRIQPRRCCWLLSKSQQHITTQATRYTAQQPYYNSQLQQPLQRNHTHRRQPAS